MKLFGGSKLLWMGNFIVSRYLNNIGCLSSITFDCIYKGMSLSRRRIVKKRHLSGLAFTYPL
jgi:hypothetical protein